MLIARASIGDDTNLTLTRGGYRGVSNTSPLSHRFTSVGSLLLLASQAVAEPWGFAVISDHPAKMGNPAAPKVLLLDRSALVVFCKSIHDTPNLASRMLILHIQNA
jgi:hypothetical protein